METIKAPRNIIIESSNSVSKNNEGYDLNLNLNQDENIKESKNNSSWNTIISNPIKLEIGDEVQIMTASINQIGSGNDTIEFLGKINNSSYVDNKIRLDMNYYITNELKFNLPMPLSTTKFYEDKDDLLIKYQNNYLDIDLSTLDHFKKAYPTENLENLTFIPSRLYKTGNDRLYLGKKDWCGLYRDDYVLNTSTGFDDINLTSKAELHFNEIDIEINTGLETPSNISNKITNIFHQKLDITDKSKYIEPIATQIHNTTTKDNFFLEKKNLFQENSYFAISNPPSRGIYTERERGLVNDMFFNESSTYNEDISNKIFWENCLMKDVNRINGVVNFNKICRSTNFSNNTISTAVNPQYYTFMNDAIQYQNGTQENTINNGTTGRNIVIADFLNLKNDIENFSYRYNANGKDQCLDLKENDVIMTNLLNTPENIELINDSLKLNEFPIQDEKYPSSKIDFTNNLFKNTLVADLQFGSIDDSLMDINKSYNSELIAHSRSNPFIERNTNDIDNTLPANYKTNIITTPKYDV